MKLYLQFCFFYALITGVVSIATRGWHQESLEVMYYAVMGLVLMIKMPFFILLSIFLALRAFKSKYQSKFVRVCVKSAIVFAATIVLNITFTFAKTTMPFIIPFYADPFFAEVDYILHFNNHPWVITHDLFGVISTYWIALIYGKLWFTTAFLFPAALLLTDTDTSRINRYLILYLVAWVLIGNVFALIGMSTGPVFYDRAYGGEAFAELSHALQASGIADSTIGKAQAWLWIAYTEHQQIFGSGISAFPSVHISVATVVGLYVAERFRWVTILSISYVSVILFLSVYTGFHYAIDGYASIVVVVMCWWGLRRFGLRSQSARFES